MLKCFTEGHKPCTEAVVQGQQIRSGGTFTYRQYSGGIGWGLLSNMSEASCIWELAVLDKLDWNYSQGSHLPFK